MASQTHQLHFVMIPLMCPGHIIPMIDMAKLLAQRAVTVTIVTTPLNATRFGAVIDRAIEAGLPIRLLQLRFPSMEAGLPGGCENVDALPSFDLIRNFFAATAMLQQPLEESLEKLLPSPSCILSDKNLAWTGDVANKLQIPWIIFDGMSCFSQLCMHNLHLLTIHECISDTEPFVVPGLPDRIELTKSQLPGAFNPGPRDIGNIRERIRAAEITAHGLVINSFEELEHRYVDEFQKIKEGKVWCLGPLSLSNKENLDKAQRGNRVSTDEHVYLRWLDTWQAGSVIYACFGSISFIAAPQLIELALGLEASNHPFIWVIRGGNKLKNVEKWLAEEGFEKRTKGRGIVIRGWAPQVLILSHPAIGGFLTHCGWNSTLEGVSAGVPMITWPQFAEQFFNEKLVVEVSDTGVSVGAPSVVHFGEEEKYGVKVGRDVVQNAVERVLKGGKEGKERRKRAKELGEMAQKATEVGGSSYLNITLLIQDVMQQANKQ